MMVEKMGIQPPDVRYDKRIRERNSLPNRKDDLKKPLKNF